MRSKSHALRSTACTGTVEGSLQIHTVIKAQLWQYRHETGLFSEALIQGLDTNTDSPPSDKITYRSATVPRMGQCRAVQAQSLMKASKTQKYCCKSSEAIV